MKAVLMAFDAIDCNLIFNGEKTIDARKVAPNLKPPYTVYMYMKAAKERFPLWEYITAYTNNKGEIVNGSQKVVGEFVCDQTRDYIPFGLRGYELPSEWYRDMRCSKEWLDQYGGLKTLRGLHITSPKCYDTPKELSEFTPWCEKSRKTDNNLEMCCECGNALFDEDGAWWGCRVARAPSSWCYVEEVVE